MPTQQCIETLRETRPDVAIRIRRYVDDYATWDTKTMGRMPEDLVAYVFEVRAYAIHNGTLYRGMETLCGSWWDPATPIGDIGGYLPQMVADAVAELDNALHAAHPKVRTGYCGVCQHYGEDCTGY